MLIPALLLGLVLTVEPVKAEVMLGEPVGLKVTVTWDGPLDSKAEGRPPVLDRRAVSLAIGEGPDRFEYQRRLEIEPARQALAAGGLSETLSWTPIRAGAYKIQASYTNGLMSVQASAETQVTVKPAAGGATELGVHVVTTLGEMTWRFLPEAAPNHVAHFAERVRTGFYDGTPFHRIIKTFMAQGGDPTGTGEGGPGYDLPAEFGKDTKFSHTFGRVSTARTDDPDSGGSQFFICFDSATRLDGKYTVFAEVVEGQETVRRLEALGLEKGDPANGMLPVEKHPKVTSAKLIPLAASKR